MRLALSPLSGLETSAKRAPLPRLTPWATVSQSPPHFLKADGPLLATFGDYCQVVKVFHHPAIFSEGDDDGLFPAVVIHNVFMLRSLHRRSPARLVHYSLLITLAM